MATNEHEKPTFDEWALVEVMGHVKLAGKVSEAAMFGTALCRVDVYPGDATEPLVTRMYGGSAIYCVTPVSEATARAFALGHQPEPVARWELAAPAAPTPRAARTADDDFPDDDRMEQDDEVDATYDQPTYR